MGFFKKLDGVMDQARAVVRDVQDSAESKVGQGMRTATGQGGASLPSVPDGRDVLAPLVAAANGLGYTYVARSESIDGVGWTLHTNRDGLSFDEDDIARGGARVTVEALNRPVASLAEWELVRRVLSDGERDETVHQAGEEVRFLTHRTDHGWQSSFLRRRLAVRVRFEGPTATEHLARDFATAVCWRYLDVAASDEWVREQGIDPTLSLGLEPFAGKAIVDTAPAEPVRLELVIPDAAETCGAIVPDDAADRIIHDWDHWTPTAELLGWAPVSRQFVRLHGWEGVVHRGAHDEFCQVIAVDCPEAVHHPDRFVARLLDPIAKPAEFEGNTIAVGTDVLGYPSAHVVVGDLPFLVRLSGPAGSAGGWDLAHAVARDALFAMPE